MSNEELKGLLLIGEDVEYQDIIIRNYKLGEIFKDLKLDKYYKLISLATVELKDIVQVDKVDINKLKLYDVLYDIYNDWILEFLNTFTYLKWECGMFRDFVAMDNGKRIRFTESKFDGFMEVFKKMYVVSRGEKKLSNEINPDWAVDEETRKFAEEILEFKKESKKRKNGNITMMGIIEGICSKSNSYTLLNIWELTVYQLMIQYYGIEQNENYGYILSSVYAGVYDTKKNKLEIDKIHWACEIEI